MRRGKEMDPHSLDFGWTKVPGIDSNQNFSGLSIFPDLIDPFSRPSMEQQHLDEPFHQLREQNRQEYLAGACATCPLRSHELRQIESIMIPPKYMDIGWRITVAPVTLRIKVAKV